MRPEVSNTSPTRHVGTPALRAGPPGRAACDDERGELVTAPALADGLQFQLEFAQRIGRAGGSLGVRLVGEHFDARTFPELGQAIGGQLTHVHHHGVGAELGADLRHGIGSGCRDEGDDLHGGVLSGSVHGKSIINKTVQPRINTDGHR
jgi:hypothetical protein